MQRYFYLVFLVLMLFSSPLWANKKAFVLELNGAIGPASQDYIVRGLHFARTHDGEVVIIQLNTPGGLESAMRGIDEAILTSPLPVITFVAPSGARAASAGTFILYASHLAAMAPGTNVGAASLVQLGGSPTPTKELSVEQQKAMNDAAAYLKSLAQLRGRNSEWTDLAVHKAASLTAEDALRLKVIDVIAEDIPDLLKKMNDRTAVVLGISEKVQTKNLTVENYAPDWRYRFLAVITNPNIAYLLLLIAFYGLFFEFMNPGLILPGVAGVIALFLALYALQLLPIKWAGLALLCIGMIFMLLEVYLSTFGIIGLGGISAFMLGSIMLLDTGIPIYQIDWLLIIGMTIMTAAFFFIIINLSVRSFRQKIVTGKEALIGTHGRVMSRDGDKLTVKVLGEIWQARSTSDVHPQETVKVTQLKGLLLTVEPVEKKK